MDLAAFLLSCFAMLWLSLTVRLARRVGWSKLLKLQVVLTMPIVVATAMMGLGLGELAFVAAIVVAGLACLSFRYLRAPFGVSNTTRSRQ